MSAESAACEEQALSQALLWATGTYLCSTSTNGSRLRRRTLTRLGPCSLFPSRFYSKFWLVLTFKMISRTKPRALLIRLIIHVLWKWETWVKKLNIVLKGQNLHTGFLLNMNPGECRWKMVRSETSSYCSNFLVSRVVPTWDWSGGHKSMASVLVKFSSALYYSRPLRHCPKP